MAELLKDVFNIKFIKKLSADLKGSYPKFDEALFIKGVLTKDWPEKALKQRMRHISENMQSCLPSDYKKAISLLKPVSDNYSGLEHMIFPDFIELCGIDDLSASVEAMEYFTENSSSEFPIRFFIIKYEKQMLAQMKKWAKSKNEHHRRLASEGCRPRLPWAIGLPKYKKDPIAILPILEALKKDESEYVRRSVANNLNDISKDNPKVVIEIAKTWKGLSPETDKLIKHGCRTLLKQGDPKTIKLFGFREPKDIQIEKFKVTKEIKMGEEIEFSFTLNTDKKKLGLLRIEYIIEFVRQNNKTGKKVFKVSEGRYDEAERKIIKKHSFKPISTRKYYTGKHSISVVVNGIVLSTKRFVINNK